MLNQNLLLTGDDGEYNLTKSLRFRSSASAYLNRTPASAGNRQTWTFSCWLKYGTISTAMDIFSAGANGSNWTGIDLRADGRVQLYSSTSGSVVGSIVWSPNVYRDTAAWYHFTVVCDTTNATSTDRFRFYVNGVQVTGISSTGGENTFPAQNATTNINTAVAHSVGRKTHSANEYFDGYLTEVNFIDGQALTPSSFGSTNALTGVWQPAKYTGTYGTNGFYLPFTNTTSTSTLGNDFSGNSNTWTVNNISLTAGSTYDSMNDVPTLTSATQANYAVLNPLNPPTGLTTFTYSNANLTIVSANGASSPATESSAYGTMYFPSTGKFYAELTIGTTFGTGSNSWPRFGVADIGMGIGGYVNFGGSSYGTFVTGDVIRVAWDASTGYIWWGKNNTWLNSGVPESGTGYISTFSYAANSAYVNISLYCNTSNNSGGSINFGQQPFAYTPPTGFLALNTYNLPTSTIVKGNTVMDATTYTGTGATQSIVNAGGFQPDFVWIKNRSSVTFHSLWDSNRGRSAGGLASNDTMAEQSSTAGNDFVSFNSNGFSVGPQQNWNVNGSSTNLVGWQWQAGQGTTSNITVGQYSTSPNVPSIASTVSVNASAGFSVVTYTGNGSTGATVGHGLGVAPAIIIVKKRSSTGNWITYHTSTGINQYLYLNSTSASATATPTWGVSSTTFTLQQSFSDYNDNGVTYVAYCWSEIVGFSKFGSYTGNGSADGTFVYLGFRPRFVMIKRSDAGAVNWYIFDTARDTYNAAGLELYPNLSNAEADGRPDLDILSNGFKIRSTSGGQNTSGATYIYACFAENPFKNALAR
jgi:hypothetical protein